ncbi:cation diffusion facilitator family transporter [Candidatus Avelusimicrobium facis]|uniref:cation diffusion facilitator family transporter n=1 Tax=Candidatus Avelusimicrobium facis TaxID=3416203 RepID=UPI003D121AA3
MSTLQKRISQAQKVTLQGLVINLVLTLVKFLAGVWGHSAAMVADAVHSLSDTATDLVVLASVKLSAKPADSGHTYGHGRFETLAAAVIALALAGVGAKILIGAIHTIVGVAQGKTLPAPGAIALWAAVLSIVIKEWLYRYTLRTARALDSQSLLANAWHHRSDALSSIGTLAGIGGAFFLGAQWTLLDPLAAVVVSLFIFDAAWHILKNVWREFSDASLGEQTVHQISRLCQEVPGVCSPHDIKTRRIGPHVSIELHLYVQDDTPFVQVHHMTEQAEQKLRHHFGPGTFIIIHPEPLSARGHH